MNSIQTIGVALVAGLALAGTAQAESDWDWTEARQEGAIWAAYALNAHLNPFRLNIDVKDGTATLRGTVSGEVEKELAEQIALGVEGIERVDNKIEVAGDRDAAQAREDGGFGQRVTDASTTAAVKSRLLWNRATHGTDIKVSTENGRVHLSGTVGSGAERDLAERVAQNTRGVDRVENDIRVDNAASGTQLGDAGDAVSDTWITTKVKTSLLLDNQVEGGRIEVRTRDGEVKLSGELDSDEERNLAIEIASDIRGVKHVDASELKASGGRSG
jgi:osmotically-inducible protein OsmY